MIVPMNKYLFVLHHDSSGHFLTKIQELGLVDIVRSQKAVDERSKEMHDLWLRYKSAVKFLSALSPDAKSKNIEAAPSQTDCPSLLVQIEETIARREQIENRRTALRKEMDAAAAWGAFSPIDKERITQLGYVIHAYTISEKRFNPEWAEQFPLFEINRLKGMVYFVVLQEQGTSFDFGLTEVKFPDIDISRLGSEMDQLDRETEQIGQQFLSLRGYMQLLEKQIELLHSELDLYLAGKSVQKEADDHIDVLTGFAPKTDSAKICAFLEEASILYIEEEAVPEDTPPIKLKNNWFARLYEPIGELYMLPKYGELDLTPFFAPFYMLFFGLCLGDMGYGLVLLIAGFAAKKFIPAMRGYASLVQLLGIGAIIMAALSGGVFGMSLSNASFLPDSVKSLFLSNIKMFWFAILFGVFQILFARLLSAIYTMIHQGWKYGMCNIGWTLLISWLAYAYASTQVAGLSIPKHFSWGWSGLALVLILFFTKTEGNIFKRFTSGIFSLYDVTGVFGDVLSYIRLFGLGTAGAILGLVVNSIAMNMAGSAIGWFFAVVMLLVGHTLVLLLSCLGAFVHPMRLTFVEFYKNVGFSGGGNAFRPLIKKIDN